MAKTPKSGTSVRLVLATIKGYQDTQIWHISEAGVGHKGYQDTQIWHISEAGVGHKGYHARHPNMAHQ